MDADEFLTVAEIAATLRLNQQTVRNWLDAGRIPYCRLGQEGRRLRVRRSDFDAFLASSGPEGEPVEPAPSISDGEVPVPSIAGTGSPSQRRWASNAGLDRFGGLAAIRRRTDRVSCAVGRSWRRCCPDRLASCS